MRSDGGRSHARHGNESTKEVQGERCGSSHIRGNDALLIVGTLNIIYGIGALDDANIFVDDTRFTFTTSTRWGGSRSSLGCCSSREASRCSPATHTAGVIGIIGGSLGAIGALLSIGGAYPWWSLAIFFLCIYIVHGIFIYGEDDRALRT